jgi:acyl carrier protein
MTRYTFAWAKLDDLLGMGIEDMLVAHWQEVATDQKAIPYAPDWDRYRHMEQIGAFKAMGAWRSDRLIGYNAFFVMPHIHYRHSVFAINDILYIDPDERGEPGVRLLLTAERDLFQQGAKKIVYHEKPALMLKPSDDMDSLDAVEALQGLEEEFGVTLPDDTLGAHTLGGLLSALGYTHFENVWAKTKP